MTRVILLGLTGFDFITGFVRSSAGGKRTRKGPMANLRTGFLALALGFCFSLANAQQPAAAKSEPVLDVSSMDQTADPCVDFFQYSCGGWRKNNPIPSDQARWSVYGKLYQDNQQFLWGILSQLSQQSKWRNASQQKI